MSWRIVRLLSACGVLAAFAAPACGGSASDPHASSAGSVGVGGSGGRIGSAGGSTVGRAGTAGTGTQPTTVPCGSKTCTGVVIPIQDFVVPPCCADEKTSRCGLDSSVLASFGPTFPEACQPLEQPGRADDSCPDSPSTPVQGAGISISFPGCCRPNHECGYQLDSVAGVVPLGLGCVDAAPFLAGNPAQTCGATGAAGAAGAGGESSGAGSGGDSAGPAGAGGDSGAAGAGG